MCGDLLEWEKREACGDLLEWEGRDACGDATLCRPILTQLRESCLNSCKELQLFKLVPQPPVHSSCSSLKILK
jgi:hypothetical protein